MPLNSSGKLSLGGTVVGESVNLELGTAADAANSMISDANKLLTVKTTGPWVFPDDWRGKARANELITGPATGIVQNSISFTVTGGVPNTAFTYTTQPGIGSNRLWMWNDFANGFGNTDSNQLVISYRPLKSAYTNDVVQHGGALQDTVTSYTIGSYTYYRGAFHYTNNVFNDVYTNYTENYYEVSRVFSGTLDANGNYSGTEVVDPTVGSHSIAFAFAATGHTRTYTYTAITITMTGPTAITASVGDNGQSWDNYQLEGGLPPYSYYYTGTIPPGVSLYAVASPYTGFYLNGYTTTGGRYNFTVVGYDANNNYTSIATSILVIPTAAMAISGASSLTFDYAYGFTTITYTIANGVPPYSWYYSGTLPAGVLLTNGAGGDANAWYLIDVVPGQAVPGSYYVIISAVDDVNRSATLGVSITVTATAPTPPSGGGGGGGGGGGFIIPPAPSPCPPPPCPPPPCPPPPCPPSPCPPPPCPEPPPPDPWS